MHERLTPKGGSVLIKCSFHKHLKQYSFGAFFPEGLMFYLQVVVIAPEN